MGQLKLVAGLILFLAIAPLALWGQESSYLTIEKQTTITQSVSLDGKSSLVVVSPHDDLVVSTNNPQDVIKKNGKDASGKYKYEVSMDISTQKDRLFTVSRKVLKETFKEQLEPDTRIYYLAEEVDVPITLLEQTGLANHHFVEGEAAVEFNTSIDDLQVIFGKGLDCSIKRTKSPTGTHIITLAIKIKPYLQLQKDYELLSTEYAQIDHKYLTEGTSLTPETLDQMEKRMDELKVQMDDIQKNMDEMSTLTIYGSQTNKLSISIAELGVKQKKSYSVLLLKERVEIFESEYAQLLRNAEQAEENRKFKIAQEFYEQAINMEKTPDEAKGTLARKIEEMKECNTHLTKATQSMAYIATLRKQNDNAKIQEVEDLFRNARISYENLYRLRGLDPYYKDLIDRIDDQLKKMDFYVIEGSVRAKNGGAGISGVSIYAVPDISMNKKIEKKSSGIKIGDTDAEGKFRVEPKRNSGYGGLLFVPENNKNFSKNGFLPMPRKHLITTVYIYE
jgi:hypothetical protein